MNTRAMGADRNGLARSLLWLSSAVSGIALVACGPGAMSGPPDVTVPEVSVRCEPLRIEPSPARVATGGSVRLRTVGGSGTALFGLEGMTEGSTIEPGGGLRGGPRAATFSAVARDGVCNLEARVDVQVVGPFSVAPAMTRVNPGGTVRFVASGNLGAVRYTVLSTPTGTGAAGTVNDEGVFTAGAREGNYELVARDEGSERSVRLTVDVGAGAALAPRAAVVLVPSGERAPLEFRGGSGSFEFAVTGAAGGRVVEESGRAFFDASMARPGTSDVAVTDRFTSERVTVRVIVGDSLGVEPFARGAQTSTGDMSAGDVNGDGRTDLLVGHSERSAVGIEAGGLLVFYGDERGGFADRPSLVIEGARARDRFGAVLLVADMNNDGIDDVLVGSPEMDLGDADRGTVELFLGSRDGLATQPDRVLLGEDGGHRFGTAFVLEDLNGDHKSDLIVSAPGAVNPTQRSCAGGRVYVYRSRGARGVFESIPWQVIDLRDSLTDDAEAFVPCANSALNAGRALAVLDLDGDAKPDLVVGAPQESHGMGVSAGQSHGAVVVYRGLEGGLFSSTPTWSIHLEPMLRASGANFGIGLDVLRANAMSPPVLVVRSHTFAPRDPMNSMRTLSNAGGLWVFAPGTLPPPASSATGDAGTPAPRIRTVTTEIARGRYYGPAANRGVGRQSLLLDVDGDGTDEYVLASSSSGAPGSLVWFSLASITMPAATISMAGELPYAVMGMPAPPIELQAYRVAALRAPMSGPGRGAALWAPWRSTMQGPYVGAVDVIAPGPGTLASRFASRTSLVLQGFGASDRSGTTVALGALAARGTVDALVGSPGTHSPANGMNPAGARLRTGAIERFSPGEVRANARAWIDRQDALFGANPVITLDFDGDGVDEVAVGDPSDTQPAMVPTTAVNADNCGAVNASGALVSASSRGSVRVYAFAGGQFVERFRAWPSREMPAGMSGSNPTFRLGRFGAALSRADVNGDGLMDLVVGRTGTTDGNGAEVVLGRRYEDAMNRVQWVCNTDDAVRVAPTQPTDTVIYGVAVAGLGDFDRDGCDETAYSITRNGSNGTLNRAGVLVAFGYGARCMGHTAPFTLKIVADDRALDDNARAPTSVAARDDDDQDLAGIPGSMGRVLAQGSGDFTGDGVPDLVYRTSDLGFRGLRGAAVEVLSGAYIAGLCPDRVCPAGRTGSFFSDGTYRVLGVRTLDATVRRVLPAPYSIAVRFGASLVLADVGGDAAAELLVGSPDDPAAGPFAGLVRIYRGGAASSTQEALLGDPWMIAVGDVNERSELGASLAASARGAGSGGASWVLVGAPSSSRHGVGGEVGVAYRFRAEVP